MIIYGQAHSLDSTALIAPQFGTKETIGEFQE